MFFLALLSLFCHSVVSRELQSYGNELQFHGIVRRSLLQTSVNYTDCTLACKNSWEVLGLFSTPPTCLCVNPLQVVLQLSNLTAFDTELLQVIATDLNLTSNSTVNQLEFSNYIKGSNNEYNLTLLILPLNGTAISTSESNRIRTVLANNAIVIPQKYGSYKLISAVQLAPPPPPPPSKPQKSTLLIYPEMVPLFPLPPPPPPSPPPSPPPPTSSSSNLGPVIGGIVGGVVLAVLAIICVIFVLCRGDKGDTSADGLMGDEEKVNIWDAATPPPGLISTKLFTYQELLAATEGFSSTHFLGEGGFGRVYKGSLSDGTMVAIKRLTGEGTQGGNEFLVEVDMLSRLRHRNLVKLLGYYMSRDSVQQMLCYELVPSGNLEHWLHGTRSRHPPMDWNTRMRIALGSARGLAYLHEDSQPCVIHRDFKASNILLTQNFRAKVGDFGLAKRAPERQGGYISTRVMGTFGYVAPEYAMTGHLLVKSDVYSYGVVLLELLTGRRPVDMTQPAGEENLVTWARPLLQDPSQHASLVDPKLRGAYPPEDFAHVAAIALACVSSDINERPTMGEVVQSLSLVANDQDDDGDNDNMDVSEDVNELTTEYNPEEDGDMIGESRQFDTQTSSMAPLMSSQQLSSTLMKHEKLEGEDLTEGR